MCNVQKPASVFRLQCCVSKQFRVAHKQYICMCFQKNTETFVLIHFPVHGPSDNKIPSNYLKLANQLKNTPLRCTRHGGKSPRNV